MLTLEGTCNAIKLIVVGKSALLILPVVPVIIVLLINVQLDRVVINGASLGIPTLLLQVEVFVKPPQICPVNNACQQSTQHDNGHLGVLARLLLLAHNTTILDKERIFVVFAAILNTSTLIPQRLRRKFKRIMLFANSTL